MARRNRSGVDQQVLNQYKQQAMQARGYVVDPAQPDNVKYEVASKAGIPLNHGYNGNLTSEQAGKIGGQIGGAMVRDMIQAAKNQMQTKR